MTEFLLVSAECGAIMGNASMGKGCPVGSPCTTQGPPVHHTSGNCLYSFLRGAARGKEGVPCPLPPFPGGRCCLPSQGIECQSECCFLFSSILNICSVN